MAKYIFYIMFFVCLTGCASDVWDRYRSDFIEEAKAIAYTDIEEGTARYLQVRGTTPATLGCPADDKAK